MTVGRAITAEAPSTRAAHGWPISRRISASGSAPAAKPGKVYAREQDANKQDKGRRGQAEAAPQFRPLKPGARQGERDRLENARRTAQPANGNRADDERIFKDQRDPDHPGDQLAEHDVTIGV